MPGENAHAVQLRKKQVIQRCFRPSRQCHVNRTCDDLLRRERNCHRASEAQAAEIVRHGPGVANVLESAPLMQPKDRPGSPIPATTTER